MSNYKVGLLLTLAIVTAALSCLHVLTSIHTYCEDRAGAVVYAFIACAIPSYRIRSATRGPISIILSTLTYAICALIVALNCWFIEYASKLCRDKLNWIWLPVVLISYAWLLLWSWLKWMRQPQRFPPPVLRSRTFCIGLASGTVSAFLFAGLWIYTHVFGPIISLTFPLAVLFYFGLSLAILGMLLSLLGKGPVRISGTLVACVMVFAWWAELAVGAIMF